MIEYKTRVRVMNPMGLHARPGVSIVRCAQAHRPTELELRCLTTNSRALGHSLLSILSLGAGRDSEIELITRGPRADELLKAVKDLFETGFAASEGANESDNEEIVARSAHIQRVGDR
ncbi:MAG: HPr family phosphocarrier protein [Betaproteobacteria bacterium]|nr:HPr family phosphocarrier protein [Betaproteobacteria bacterium]